MVKNDFSWQKDAPAVVFREVLSILKGIFSPLEIKLLKTVFNDVQALYNGKYPGFRGCNTAYHDFSHVMETFMLTARLIHGAGMNNIRFTPKTVLTGLVSALVHDSGYIQSVDDTVGTGAKYTATHVARSVRFAGKYLKGNGYRSVDAVLCENCIACTDFDVDVSGIEFSSRNQRIMGMIVGTADILGQLAGRSYLEKLSFLYREFKECQMGDYVSEFDLLEKSLVFIDLARTRLKENLGDVRRYLNDHYRERLGVGRDFDSEGMNKNAVYLEKVVRKSSRNYRTMLKRSVPGRSVCREYSGAAG